MLNLPIHNDAKISKILIHNLDFIISKLLGIIYKIIHSSDHVIENAKKHVQKFVTKAHVNKQ